MPLVTVSTLADWTGLDRRTCVRRLSALAHVEKKGTAVYYDSAVALRRLYHADSENHLDPGQEKALYDKRRRERVEQQIQEDAGKLVRKSEVAKDLADAAAIITNAIENLPDRLAPALHHVDQEQARAALEDAVLEAQTAISDALEAAAHGG